MRVLFASILVGALVAPASRPARADAPASEADTETAAQVHLDRGVAAYGAGDFTLAHQELLIAVELVPHKPNPYRWLALTEIQMGDCAHARLDVDSFLARVPADDPRIPELVRARDACQQKGVPRVVPRPEPEHAPLEPRPASERPLVTRWWFWTAIGLSAAAVVGAFVFAAQGDDATALPGVRCDASGCR